MARVFQDKNKPQSYSLMVAEESLKLLIALEENKDFEMASMDIRVAFLQAKILDRDVFARPPQDQRVEGYL